MELSTHLVELREKIGEELFNKFISMKDLTNYMGGGIIIYKTNNYNYLIMDRDGTWYLHSNLKKL